MNTPASDEQRYLVLVEFVYKHLDFLLAELESVLDMYGIELGGPDCEIVPLPQQHSTSSSGSMNKQSIRPFTVLSFPSKDMARLSDYESSRNRGNVDKWDSTKVDGCMGISDMLSRCTLVKSVVELWGFAASMADCAALVSSWVNDTPMGKSIFKRVSDASQSWKLSIHTLGAKYSRAEQDAMRKQFSYLGFDGPVDLAQPDNEYILIREVEMDGKGSPLYPRHHLGKKLIPENDARPPLACYFGRVLGGVRKGREGLQNYDLKKRVYLGPTSMDAELSFVMTSFGQVRKGSIVYDPFVGTGSILLSCAIRGAYCVGSDIDIRVLKGRSPNENILSNFRQFNLPRPELIRSDNSIYSRQFRSHAPIYNAIICDPPYGIRAGARKTGSRHDNPRPIADEHRHDHIAQTKPYAVSDVMEDLLDVASRTLVMGGRLVYIIPSFSDFNPETDLPRHDCLQLVHSCYQPLSLELGRRIVAMKKVQEYDPSLREAYMSKVWKNGRESAEKVANIREKIIEAAKKKPGYAEKAAIRKQKRKATKEARKQAKMRASETTDM